ncbi:PD-(D/E)XK nuclease-like domain-containing protein [Hymenobacter cellulosilyticus]|uniref:PD-(D/E)XK nuclease-like domain-containing protein n=1 Tax=Hymenobacter cellulosilyticus TaxID=2932248 RepID=A0A8T9Q7P2_9BACT|nr:PD-(D/E)XK nuclease-like domain-containing protein [Hymenobacter cellulosilyticus]UOQ71529.1 PD-(D/E)XK nuclease-like domain-containing protein [Hymenobacter cellulosilyticus]
MPTTDSFRRPDLLRLPYDDYRALPAIANSDLSRLRDALNGRYQKPSAMNGALGLGTAFHTALLEPELYEAGQPGINDSLIWWMVEGVKLDPYLNDLLLRGTPEPSCIFTEPTTDTVCKLRADLVAPETDRGYTIIDFKTTMARDYNHFLAQCSGYDYDRQAAFYLDALQADQFLLVGVQKVEPFSLFTVEVPTYMLEEGRAKYLRLLQLLQPGAEVPSYLSAAVRDVRDGLTNDAE